MTKICYNRGMSKTTKEAQMTPKCTYGPMASTGERCGRPAVASFRGSDGKMYHECAVHHMPIPVRDLRIQKGSKVQIRRYGKVYEGVVTYTTATRAEVRFVYKNGVERTVWEPLANLERDR